MIIYKSTRKIRPEKLYKVYESVGWTKEVRNKKKHSELLSNVYAHSDGVISAWDESELVGVVRFITDEYAHSVIYGLAVRPEYQGNGIGYALVKKCIKKYPKTSWSAGAESKQAVELFKSLGFQTSKDIFLETQNCPV